MIDSHSHIYTKPYRDDRDAVIQRARDAGITQLLQVGCSVPESRLALDLARRTPGIYASVGIHPHDADTWNDQARNELSDMALDEKVIAYGEIGLDFYYDNSPRDTQVRAFKEQMQLVQAHQKAMPVVIHTRDAEAETLEVLRAHPISRGGHVHCYTGTLDTAKRILDMGFHLGFTGVITFKKSDKLREVVRHAPLDRILIETDSPYLAPVPKRGRRNEPAFVRHVAETIAEVKEVDVNRVLEQTSANFYRLYGNPSYPWDTL